MPCWCIRSGRAKRQAEEFRSLRTRLNHLQTTQPLHTLVVTSASPAEGKSFTAANLAMTQAQIADKRILLADFDFRRPNVDKTFQMDCAPGITDYLARQGAAIGDAAACRRHQSLAADRRRCRYRIRWNCSI